MFFSCTRSGIWMDSAEFREICEMTAWEHARYYEADTFQLVKLSPRVKRPTSYLQSILLLPYPHI